MLLNKKPIRAIGLLAYALPVVSTSFIGGAAITVLQGLYSKHYGLALTSIALVLLISQLFDAVSDPIIGYLSDCHYKHTGSRKPFVIFGGLLFVLSSYFLYVPIGPVTFTYFLIFFLAYFLAITLFDIPHSAWGCEISRDPVDRNRLFAYRALAMNLGFLLFFSLPQLPIFITAEFTPDTMKLTVLIAGLLLLPSLYICARFAPNSHQYQVSESASIERKTRSGQHKNELIRAFLKNMPFVLFMCAFFFSMTGAGMYFSLLFIYVDSYLGFGTQFSFLSMVSLIAGILAISLWYRVAAFLDKKLTWGLGVVCIAIGIWGMASLVQGEAGLLRLLLMIVLVYVGFACVNMMSPSLLSDIVDFGTWKYGSDYAASCFSIYTLVVKASWAVGGAGGLGLAGWYNFDPSSAGHTAETIVGLHLAIVWLPTSLTMISLIFIALVPINARRHRLIRKALDRRELRQNRICDQQ